MGDGREHKVRHDEESRTGRADEDDAATEVVQGDPGDGAGDILVEHCLPTGREAK